MTSGERTSMIHSMTDPIAVGAKLLEMTWRIWLGLMLACIAIPLLVPGLVTLLKLSTAHFIGGAIVFGCLLAVHPMEAAFRGIMGKVERRGIAAKAKKELPGRTAKFREQVGLCTPAEIDLCRKIHVSGGPYPVQKEAPAHATVVRLVGRGLVEAVGDEFVTTTPGLPPLKSATLLYRIPDSFSGVLVEMWGPPGSPPVIEEKPRKELPPGRKQGEIDDH
jgi:hypothetical protein